MAGGGFGPINGAGTSDMLMRNVNTGAFEVYDIGNNQLTAAASMGQVGTEWQVAGIAADPPSASGVSNNRLAQAMASFTPTDAAFDTSAPLSVAITQPSSAILLTADGPHTNST